MSLAWEANDIYGSSLQISQVPDPVQQARYLDLLFGDPATRLTLGLNAARYNVGGGENPTHFHMRKDAQMEGYLASATSAYDWSRDATQRRMLHEAQARGANIFEAFSNSPPYWMTYSGSASGATKSGADNLRSDMYTAFANYLVTVVKHFQDVEGITFESLEPFNEPDGGAWTSGGSQEGCSAAASTQNTVIPLVKQALQQQGLSTMVSGTDAGSIDSQLYFLQNFSSTTLAALGRVNTHSYDGSNRSGLYSFASGLGKPIWMSEVGCCFGGQGDGTEIWGALFMADQIRMDVRDMSAQVWAFWQPDWSVINFNGGNPIPQKQFYAMAQYTNFIRPEQGFSIVSAGANNTLGAYSPSTHRLVLVATNHSSAVTNNYDLTQFSPLPVTVTRYQTTASSTVNLQASTVGVTPQAHLIDNLPVNSVTTYVIDLSGTAPAPSPSPGHYPSTITGNHPSVSRTPRRLD